MLTIKPNSNIIRPILTARKFVKRPFRLSFEQSYWSFLSNTCYTLYIINIDLFATVYDISKLHHFFRNPLRKYPPQGIKT